MANVNEIFMPIKGYEGIYEVSNLGRVKSLERIIMRPTKVYSRILKPHCKIYSRVVLCDKDKNKGEISIHRLVAENFIPNPENKPFVNHIDGNKNNNALLNLEWVTPSENQLHAHTTGLSHAIKGSKHSNSKLTEEEVVEIYRSKKKQKDLALEFKVSQASIFLIKKGINWKETTDKICRQS